MEFTLQDYLSTSNKHPDRVNLATLAVQQAAEDLLVKLNTVLSAFYGTMPVNTKIKLLSSGYRNPAANEAQGGSTGSYHMSGRAADVEDNDRELAVFCLSDLPLLEHVGLWLEDPTYTKEKDEHGKWLNWVHFQTRPPKSGKRIFAPTSTRPR